MDAIKVSKVERVQCRRAGQTISGVLHLTAHHLIYEHDAKSEEELWIPYPMISLVTRTPMALEGYYPLSIHLRSFRSLTLSFEREAEALDVFDSIRGLTVASSVSQLYAFFYTPNPPFERRDGWSMYSLREEFARMGVGTRTKAWRFTDINKDYTFSPTYPARLVIPTRISDTTLQYASKYRSKCRIPTLAYLHWASYATITRSSQPMVGIKNNRSIQDEKLIEAIFQSHHSPESRVSAGPVYGATATNLIIDARPTTNAMANVAKGAGTENMDYYRDGKKAYLGIDNIHVMRDSLNRVVEALRDADGKAQVIEGLRSDIDRASMGPVLLDRQALRRSGWLRHLSAILEGTVLIVRNIHVNSSHVLIHCSDGWDRTAQLSSLAQLCLDPFYRTYKGFQILVEKDWLSFGHRFLDRCGHLSSEKIFLSATDVPSGGGAEAAQALLASVQNKFVGQGHLRETSPVFHQFLECVRQIQRQFPERFEFNARYLERIHYHLYSCQFGTFLFNNERERRVADSGLPPYERTVSVWDLLNSASEVKENLNPLYDPKLDDPSRRDAQANMGVLFPDPRDVRFWIELYARTDEEMNGKLIAAEVQGADIIGPVEGTEDDLVSPSADTVAGAMSPELTVTLPASLPSSRSLTPTPATASARVPANRSTRSPPNRSLSSSMPDLSHQKPRVSRQDSFRPFPNSSSNFSLRSTGPGKGTASNNTAREDVPGRNQSGAVPADFFPEGVRSIWGKLSSNATAAFSAVQGAYDGVAREFKGLAPPHGSDTPRAAGGEMRDRTRSDLADEVDWSGTSSTTQTRNSELAPSWSVDASVPSERWRKDNATSGLSTLSLENPWRTQPREKQTPPSRGLDDPFSSSVWASEDAQQTRHSADTASGTEPSAANQATAVVTVSSERKIDESNNSINPNVNKDGGDPLGVL